MSMSKRPAIGFIGYAGDWQKSSFADDMISFHTGTGKLGTETNTGIPLIKMGNLQRGYFDFEKEEFLAEGETVSSESMVNFGDFLFNTRNTLELVGKGATWAGKSGMFAFNNNIAKLNLRNVDTMFFNYLYNTEKLLAQVHATAMGTTSVAAIYPRSLGTIQYYFPEPEEQKRISALFRKLDELLFVQQRKYDKLLTYKKAMLEKLFPKDGADVPEVRFTGFLWRWEYQEASSLFTEVIEKGYPDLPVLSATQDRGMVFRDETGKQIYHNKENEVGYKRVVPGQFVIHLRSFQGGFAHSAFEGITSPAYTVFGFQNSEQHDSYFWKYIFSSEAFIKRLETVTYGIRDGRSISYNEFLTLKFRFPEKREQQRIAEFFCKVDELIEANSQRLQKLTALKKALLDKMFV